MIDEKVLIERLENRIEYNKACHEKFPNAKMSLVYEVQINTYKNAIQIVKDLASEHNNGWISVANMLPEEGKLVLFSDKYGLVRQGTMVIFYGQKRYDLDGEIHTFYDDEIIAWQPLPPAPKKGE